MNQAVEDPPESNTVILLLSGQSHLVHDRAGTREEVSVEYRHTSTEKEPLPPTEVNNRVEYKNIGLPSRLALTERKEI